MMRVKASLVGLAMLAAVACTSTAPSGSTSSRMRVLAPSDCTEDQCGGSLDPGRYRATFDDPTIAFEISSPGWTWSFDHHFVMVIAETPNKYLYSSDGIYFLRNPGIAAQDCSVGVAERGVGHSVDALVAWLEAAPGLAVSEPMAVTIGGLHGVELDVQLDPAWTQTCSWSRGLPAVPLIHSRPGPRRCDPCVGGYYWSVLPDQSMRWYILNVDDGVIIVDVEDGPGGLSHDDLLATGGEVVASLAFSPSS